MLDTQTETAPAPEIQDHKALIEQRRQAWREESDLRDNLAPELKEMIGPVAISKERLNPDPESPITHNPNDEIEIEPRPGKWEPEWWVRNKTIAQQPPRTLPKGELADADVKTMAAFLEEYRLHEIGGSHKIEAELREMQQDGSSKAFIWQGESGQIAGLACYKESTPGAIKLSTLVVRTDLKNQGTGSAIIRALQQRFNRISLGAVPIDYGREISTDKAFERLRRFYRKNGFAGGEWQKPPAMISLEDQDLAGEWQKAEIQVVVDQYLTTTVPMARAYLAECATNQDLFAKLPSETQTKLQQWQEKLAKYEELDKKTQPRIV